MKHGWGERIDSALDFLWAVAIVAIPVYLVLLLADVLAIVLTQWPGVQEVLLGGVSAAIGLVFVVGSRFGRRFVKPS